MTIYDVDPAIIRCLAHGPKEKSACCDRADRCLAHVAIRTTPFDGSCTIVQRRCSPWEYDQFLPVDRTAALHHEGDQP